MTNLVVIPCWLTQLITECDKKISTVDALFRDLSIVDKSKLTCANDVYFLKTNLHYSVSFNKVLYNIMNSYMNGFTGSDSALKDPFRLKSFTCNDIMFGGDVIYPYVDIKFALATDESGKRSILLLLTEVKEPVAYDENWVLNIYNDLNKLLYENNADSNGTKFFDAKALKMFL